MEARSAQLGRARCPLRLQSSRRHGMRMHSEPWTPVHQTCATRAAESEMNCCSGPGIGMTEASESQTGSCPGILGKGQVQHVEALQAQACREALLPDPGDTGACSARHGRIARPKQPGMLFSQFRTAKLDGACRELLGAEARKVRGKRSLPNQN